MKIAREGTPFIVGSFILTGIVYLFARNYSVAVPVLLTLFIIYFFRDPDRLVPQEKDVFVSPADGKVIIVKSVPEKDFLKRNAKQISIFMSPLNVHVNRSPASGKVTEVVHKKGQFRAAYSEAAANENESTSMVLETEHGPVLVRQVAGFIARRIVCRSGVGDTLSRGQRYGLIKFSSRVDLFLPEAAKITVSVGDTVKAGETILARMAG